MALSSPRPRVRALFLTKAERQGGLRRLPQSQTPRARWPKPALPISQCQELHVPERVVFLVKYGFLPVTHSSISLETEHSSEVTKVHQTLQPHCMRRAVIVSQTSLYTELGSTALFLVLETGRAQGTLEGAREPPLPEPGGCKVRRGPKSREACEKTGADQGRTLCQCQSSDQAFL